MKTKKLLSMVVMTLFTTISLSAQTAANKYALDVDLIKNEYSGDYGNGLFNFGNNFFGLGLTLNKYLTTDFNVGVELSYGDYGFKLTENNQFKGAKTDLSIFGTYKLNNGYILSEKSKIAPFVQLGLGLANYTDNSFLPNPMIIEGIDIIVPIGVGCSFQISDKLAIKYKYLYNITSSDKRDQNTSDFNPIFHGDLENVNDAFGKHVISIALTLGGKKDEDKDGVYDKADLCPGTLTGVQVDDKGCPKDADKDGVADYLDKCPDTPAEAKADQNGCPLDTDKDGVPDYLDKCANTPAKVKVDSKGCPVDSDGDGIPDFKDKCPNDKGIAANNGCPEVPKPVVKEEPKPVVKEEPKPVVKEEPKKIPDLSLIGVQFETGKDIINPVSYPVLNEIVSILKNNPEYTIEIKGHTDNQGSADLNLQLSQKRAEMIKVYLVSKGTDENRINAKGLGSNEPIADNATPEGRAKNRRVEFILK